jgi:hypothetical protein
MVTGASGALNMPGSQPSAGARRVLAAHGSHTRGDVGEVIQGDGGELAGAHSAAVCTTMPARGGSAAAGLGSCSSARLHRGERHPLAALGMVVIEAGALAFAGGPMRHRPRAR